MAAEATAILATGNEDQERTVNPSLIAVTVTLATLMELLRYGHRQRLPASYCRRSCDQLRRKHMGCY